MRKKLFFSFCLIMMLLLAACSLAAGSRSTSNSGYSYAATEAPSGSSGYTPPREEIIRELDAQVAAQPTMPAPADAAERLIVRNAYLTLVVKDPAAAAETIVTQATAAGGFVVSSSVYQQSVDSAGNKIVRGEITVRVPAEKLSEVLAQIKGLAVTVKSENVTGEDVTAQFVDLQSQLNNLELTEQELQTILKEAKESAGNDATTKTQDVLAVYRELTSIRGQIDQIKGQMQYFQQSAALSLVQITLEQDISTQPIETGGWKAAGVLKDILEAWTATGQVAASAGMWFAIYCLPIGLVLGIPLYIGIRLLRRRTHKAKTALPPTD